jgi:hypothetical protein
MSRRATIILAVLTSLVVANPELDAKPKPPVWSTIRVQDVLTGKPVVGARLRTEGGAKLVAPSTGPDGVTHCSHRVSPNITILAEGAGYQLGMCWVTRVTRDSLYARATLKRINRAIQGSVVNGQSGRSLKDVTVRVGSGEACTDSLGRFVLRGVCNSRSDIKAVHPKLPYQVCSITAGEGDTVIAHISMYGSSATGTLFGTVTDAATGEPIAGATIRVDGTDRTTIDTDGNGNYEVRGIPPGEYRVGVTHTSYAGKRVHEVTLTPDPPVRVDLAVRRIPGR